MKFFYNKYSIYFILTSVAFLVRYFLLEDRESWHDEWHSIYVSDPNINFSDTMKRFYGDKGDTILTEYYPPLYLFFLKYTFLIFGYSDHVGRLLSVVAGTLIIPASIYLSSFFLDKKQTFFVSLLLIFNLFLFWQSAEIRAHSILVLSSLVCIILFIKLLDKKNLYTFILYFIISVYVLSLWPISGTIFFGKTMFLINKFFIKKKLELKLFLVFTLILTTYLILNKNYLIYNLARDSHYTVLYDSFFYNYHFRTFFGSKLLGGIYLLLFSYFLILNLKNLIFKSLKINLLVYIILSSYFLTLTYTIFRASIMSPKYVIFIVPLILIWICVNLSKYKNGIIYSLVLTTTTIIFFSFNINNHPIKRPPITDALKIIIKDNSKNIIIQDNDVFKNYVKTKKIFQDNNMVLLENYEQQNDDINSIWFLCLNNARFAVGDKKLEDDLKCKNFKLNDTDFIFISTHKLPDFLLKKFKKN
tara:strand:+ start:170 stop:1588 length:1419 start_codon:yes stop_codon:yes gene_type:complete